MSDEVDRLKAELALAEEVDELEEARAAMHKKKTDATLKAYRKASEKVAAARQALREKHPTTAASAADGVARPEPIRVSGRAVSPR
jgi:cytidylate kinase